MHYQNGREAKVGDKIIHLPTGIAGVLEGEKSGDNRLAKISRKAGSGVLSDFLLASECLHVEDVKQAKQKDS